MLGALPGGLDREFGYGRKDFGHNCLGVTGISQGEHRRTGGNAVAMPGAAVCVDPRIDRATIT